MPALISKIGILNRAAQILGQPSISNLNENSTTARALLRSYDPIFLKAIEAHVWNFSVRRANLAADATPPVFGQGNYFPLPGDFLYLAPEETTRHNPYPKDYNLEILNDTLCIVSPRAAPLPIRYVSSNINEGLFSATFAESFAHELAYATCEELTNSNTKLQNIARGLDLSIRLAKRRNDIQKSPVKSPTCSFISVRD